MMLIKTHHFLITFYLFLEIQLAILIPFIMIKNGQISRLMEMDKNIIALLNKYRLV